MPVVNGYCELDELQEWNGAVTGPVPNLERAINAASRGIDQYCQRHFYKDGTTVSPVARRFGSCGYRSLRLGAFNDLASASLTVKTDEAGDGTFETTWLASDYELLPINPTAAPESRPYTEIRSTGTRLFPAGTSTGRSERVEVTGIWGWPEVPAGVNQACVILASRLYKRKDSPEGVSGWGDFGVVRVVRTDPDVMALLDPYRRTAVLVA